MYFYIKAVHLIFVVTWFAGLFYIVRLFIYNTEAGDKSPVQRDVLRDQFSIMLRRLWYGITWPSAIGTCICGAWLWYTLGGTPPWLYVKALFLIGLILYHLSLHYIFKQEMRGIFAYSSFQLRIWNEVATIFLVAIIFLAVIKDQMSALWGLIGLFVLMIVLGGGIYWYRRLRNKGYNRSQK
jgi:putative membrane protein